MKCSRRKFMWTLAGGAAVAALPMKKARAARVGANDKIRIAVIGNGGMGGRHVDALALNDNCTIVALCDVAMSRYYGAADRVEAKTGKRPDGYQDFRQVLDRQDIDAVWVATPDHWHPLLTILACQAGKDVYVEKPVCTTVAEGRAMVQAARRYGRIVQAGTQQRSMPVFQKAIDVIRSGRIGELTSARAWIGANEFGLGETPAPVPKGLDWDMWLGPAPWTPYSPERFGGFMGWWDYARGGQLTNWGIHLMDIVQWGIGQDRPLSLEAIGGSFRKNAGGDNYETLEAVFEYKGCMATWEQRHKDVIANKDYGIAFYGTEGTLAVNRGTFTVTPDALGIPEYVGEPELSWANTPHHNNFFESVRSRKLPIADIEQGFRSTTTVLLAGIALRVGRKLHWDADAEKFINDDEANRYLQRSYRSPWHL